MKKRKNKMQGHYKTYFLQDNLKENDEKISDINNDEISENCPGSDIFGMAELVAGYMDCMEETLRYLKDVEQYAEDHPAVVGLRKHLAVYRKRLISKTINSKENIPNCTAIDVVKTTYSSKKTF